ncbi:uncharacterized protein yc1106_07003 [Curvularia clavata]|uniref:Major facilitator superfamily (MFS) profile domain-containing protein n=1 Tax=Curvularia clavata TaxID=95742 RepID=A0A9Q8ZDZ5_CURCL|nr:uncharacterized protein yc1106_07003 [Curvularia clavata]
MASAVSQPDPTQETQHHPNRDEKEIYEQVQDADTTVAEDASMRDPEKAIKSPASSANSTHSDQRTLSNSSQPGDGQQADPDIVDWDGPDDPENPLNWPAKKKWMLIANVSFMTLISPAASSFFAPGVPQVMRAFHETSSLIGAFVVSVYVLGFAFGPMLIAPLSELYGRSILYHAGSILFVIFSIACAVSDSMGMLIAFRFLAGCAGSTPLTIGGGSVADMFPVQERAGAMAIWAMGALIGPVVGPIGGGYLVERLVWRWVFWILAIAGGVASITFLFVGHETYHPVLLERKTKALIKSTGNTNLRSKLAKDLPPKKVFAQAIVRPMKMLFLSPIVFLMCLYVSLNYGILYLFFTTITFVFERQYHFSSGSVGLAYLGIGIGMAIGLASLGIWSDKFVIKHQKKGNLKPEHRLPIQLTLPGAVLLPIGVIIYGWTTQHKVHWIVPIMSMSFIGLGNLTCLMTAQTYLVDAFTIHAASAMAANTILRSIFGGVLPLAGLPMFNQLGLGWGNTLLGLIALAFIPVPILFRYYGERIRTNPKFQVQL